MNGLITHVDVDRSAYLLFNASESKVYHNASTEDVLQRPHLFFAYPGFRLIRLLLKVL